MARFAVDKKIRIVSPGVDVTKSVAELIDGVSHSYLFNKATLAGLDSLERACSGAGAAEQCTTGITGRWHGFDLSLTLVE